MNERRNWKIMVGIALLLAAIIAIIGSTWDLVETLRSTYPFICPFCVLGWIVSIVASANSIGFAFEVGFRARALSDRVVDHWGKGNWMPKKGLSIIAIICGLITTVTAIGSLSSIIGQSLPGYEFFYLRWIAHLIVGLASLVSGIFSLAH